MSVVSFYFYKENSTKVCNTLRIRLNRHICFVVVLFLFIKNNVCHCVDSDFKNVAVSKNHSFMPHPVSVGVEVSLSLIS